MDEKNIALKKRDERIVRFHKGEKKWGLGIKSIERFRSFPVSLN